MSSFDNHWITRSRSNQITRLDLSRSSNRAVDKYGWYGEMQQPVLEFEIFLFLHSPSVLWSLKNFFSQIGVMRQKQNQNNFMQGRSVCTINWIKMSLLIFPEQPLIQEPSWTAPRTICPSIKVHIKRKILGGLRILGQLKIAKMSQFASGLCLG